MSETKYRSHHDSRSPTGWAEREAVLYRYGDQFRRAAMALERKQKRLAAKRLFEKRQRLGLSRRDAAILPE